MQTPARTPLCPSLFCELLFRGFDVFCFLDASHSVTKLSLIIPGHSEKTHRERWKECVRVQVM